MIAFLCTRPDRANDPSSRTAYANGAFILIRRSCLYALGGHARVRAELVEDLRLAQWAKREGYRVHVVQSRGICVTRMYDSPSRFWRGWVRLFASGADSVQHLVRIWALFCAVGLLPALGLAASLLLAWPAPVSSTAGLTVALTWGAALLLQHAAMSRVYHRCRSFSGLVGLLGGWAIVTGILGHAILARAGRVGVIWRGTTYSARRGLGNPLGANSGMPDGSRG
jgi:hypothetical protein